MNNLPFLTSAPGKIILFGEHSAVYGKKAIAASINSLRTYLYVDKTTSIQGEAIVLNFPDIKFYHVWSKKQLNSINVSLENGENNNEIDPQLSHDLLTLIKDSNITNQLHINATFCFLYLYFKLIPNHVNLQFNLLSTSPIGAGLGSSAAISVCLSMAMLSLNADNHDIADNKQLINQWAFIGEKCIHGNPSGIDNLVSTFGGIISYKRSTTQNQDFKILPNNNCNNSLDLLLTYTRVTRSTKTLVNNVKSLYDSYPEIVGPILISMDMIANKAETIFLNAGHNMIIDSTECDVLNDLINLNQCLLESLNVSHDSIDKIKRLSKQFNVGATKLTGAGGGGCTFTLIDSHVDQQDLIDFKNRLNNDYGFETMDTELGGDGCLIVRNDSLSNDIIQRLNDLFHNNNNNNNNEMDNSIDDNKRREKINQLLLPGQNQLLNWK